MWEDSLFAQPIQALLHAAYANASLYALRSAAHKLLNYAQQAREYLDFRAHGLNVACEQLRQNIHQVEESLQLLQLNQAQVSGEIKHEIELALTSANHFLRQQQDALNAQLAALFQDDSESLRRCVPAVRHCYRRRRTPSVATLRCVLPSLNPLFAGC